MIKKTLSLFILHLITGSLFAQTPFIRNFPTEEYRAYSQNWAMVQDQRGIIYFGNQYGVLEYDGITWRTITTPSTVYSLCIDSSDCIYVGLDDDFGYLQSDSTGSLKYKSLKNKIPEEHQDLKKVWDIKTVGGKIILWTVNKTFVYQNDSLSVLTTNKKSKQHFVIRGKYYIFETEKGLMFLKGDSLIQMPGAEQFFEIEPLVMLPYGDDELLIVTDKNVVKIYNPKKSPCLRKPDEFDAVNKFLDKNIAYYAGVKLPNGYFAIGTKVGGILVFDKQGKIQNHYNKQNGLQSNGIYYLFTDLNGQLWASLESGISLIMSNLPFSNYTFENGLDGSIYCIHKFKDKLYVGTSNNFYVQNKENNFERIEGTEGQNFFLLQAKEKLLLGNSPNGIFEINDNQVVQQLEALKKSVPIVAITLRKHPNYIIIQVVNKGLALIEYKNEQWVFKHFIKGFDKNTRYIEEDDNGNFWLSTNVNDQFYKLRLNETLDSVIFLQDFTAEQYHLPEASARPYHLNNGEIIFSTDKGIYRYLPHKNYFELHPDFPMFPKGVSRFKQDSCGIICFEEVKEGLEKGVLLPINGKYEMYKTPFLKFTASNIANAYALYPFSDSLVYFGTNKGLLEYHPKQTVNYDIPFNTLIREIFVNDSLIYGGAENNSSSMSDNPVILKYKNNNLFFHYAATFYEESEKNLFSYRLIGSSNTTWSAWTNNHKKEYNNLQEGKYIFEVKSQNIYRKYGNKASFAFEIRPPWHRTWLAYTLYGILAIVFVLIIIRLNSARLKRNNKLLKQIVEKRTADLQESNDKLNLLNSTKDKFFTIISHDLKSPFNSILGFTNLLAEDYNKFDETQKRKIISSLRESSQLAYELLENLLTWARTQTGRIEINKELLNLKELVETSIAPYKDNASKKNIEIAINIPPDTKLSIDRNTSMTFIANLVNNAIKYTPEGGTITINYHENEDNIELHIIDTGVGMTSEVIGKLFRIDEDISTEGTNNERGTGLGLILCKEFINKNGGDISVLSEVGKGSEFIITLSK